ncbi:MAG TPA: Na+ dependent nucleoside transporter N-terminal domain-containing protein, partial [Thermoanaerobaculia bacterium]|nr:Na+ dependent nucleoside transporter N-terminal domain-containing protein [Thermoanaerobaculia bacterium]
MDRFRGVLGLLAVLALCYLFSANRRAIKARTVLWGLGLQILFAT